GRVRARGARRPPDAARAGRAARGRGDAYGGRSRACGARAARPRGLPRAQPERGRLRPREGRAMKRRARYLVLAISMVAGCGLGARPDRSRFFTLAPLGPEELTTVPAGKLEMSLGLGPIVFPGYLDRMSVVRRTQANEIAISTFDRWAEPLREAFRTTLQQNLVGLLGTPRVVLYPWQRTERPELAIDVVVLRFEATETGDADVAAQWHVVRVADGGVLVGRPWRLERGCFNRAAASGSTGTQGPLDARPGRGSTPDPAARESETEAIPR